MTESPENRLEEIHLYERVAEEIEQGKQVKGLWLKALVESDNDQEKAKAVYAKLRVEMLRDVEEISGQADPAETHSDKYTQLSSNWEFEDNCAKLTATKEDISTFIFPNGDEICLMYDEILNSFKGAGFKIRTGGADNWEPPFQTTLFQIKSAHEVDKFQKILAAKIEKSSHQMIKGGASVHNFGKWDTLVKAIMICRTRDEVASLFHDAYSRISKG